MAIFNSYVSLTEGIVYEKFLGKSRIVAPTTAPKIALNCSLKKHFLMAKSTISKWVVSIATYVKLPMGIRIGSNAELFSASSVPPT